MTDKKLQTNNRDVRISIPYQHFQQGNGKIRLNINNQVIWLPESVKIKTNGANQEFMLLRSMAERLGLSQFIVENYDDDLRRLEISQMRILALKRPKEFKKIAEEI